jgi:hypothetical protein
MSLTYNGIPLTFIHTQSVQQEPVADPSGTDQLYTRIRIAVSSVFHVNPGNISALLPVLSGETPVATMVRVRHMLLLPRRRLIFAPTGSTMIDVGGDTNPDDAHGPRPISCTVKQLTPAAFLVDYAVEAYIRDCTGADAAGYLSLRWSDTVSYDKDWLCTRRRAGLLVLSSANGRHPDSFRFEVTPNVPTGFRRESAEYRLSESFLQVAFSFTDKELMKAVPDNALTMTGRQVETSPMKGGVRMGQLTVRLTGPKPVDPKELLNKCVLVAMSRVHAAGVMDDKNGRFLIGATIEETLDDSKNEVTLTVEWQIKADQVRVLAGGGPIGPPLIFIPNADGKNAAALGGTGKWVGAGWEGADTSRAIAPPVYGVAEFVGLVAARLCDPCGVKLIERDLRAGGPNDFPAADDAGEIRLFVGEVSEDSDASYRTDDTTPGTYDTYEITSHYTLDPGEDVLPSTKAGDPGRKVKTHAGAAKLQVDWSVSRVGGPPEIPSPQPKAADTNVVFVGGTVSPEGLDLAADGVSVRHVVTGVYNYKFLAWDLVKFAAAIPPFLSFAAVVGAAGAAASLTSGLIHFPVDQVGPPSSPPPPPPPYSPPPSIGGGDGPPVYP